MKIALLGAGNVGWHLGHRLAQQGLLPVQVFSPRLARAQELAQALGTQAIHTLAELRTDADLYLLAVPDAAISPLALELQGLLPPTALLAHTSGATPSEALGTYFVHTGVFYPLQTFSRAHALDFAQVPLCICASTPQAEQHLLQLAHQLSHTVQQIDDQQRATLHLAAVFVNNFTNCLYGVGQAIVQEQGLPFQLLQALITETAAKIQRLSPAEAQTGPARRHDQATIDRHLALLAQHPQWQQLYALMTAEIQGAFRT